MISIVVMKIAPSILDAHFGQLQNDIDSLVKADRIHLDVMDGHYVPGMTFGAAIFGQVNFPIEFEVHLMVENPHSFFESFIKLGAMGITFHVETVDESEIVPLLMQLKSAGIKAGIGIDGYTETEVLSDEVLKVADQILIMSVKAGKGGQSFMPQSLKKCEEIRRRGFTEEIEFDGGVKDHNVAQIKTAGADIVVMGSYLMRESPEDRAQLIQDIQSI